MITLLTTALMVAAVGCQSGTSWLPSRFGGLPKQWEPENAGQADDTDDDLARSDQRSDSDDAIGGSKNYSELFEAGR